MPLNKSPGLCLGQGLGEKGKGDLPSNAARGWLASDRGQAIACRETRRGGKRAANQDDRAQLPQLRMQI